jgi:hypothetical protein
VRITRCLGVELEQLSQVVLGEVSCGILCLIDHAGREVLLLASNRMSLVFSVGLSLDLLPLEDLFLDRSGGLESVHEAY